MPGPLGILVGLTQAELAALRVEALSRMSTGERTSISGGGKSGSKAFQMSPQDVLREIIYAEQVGGIRAARAQKVEQVLNRQYPLEEV